MMSDYRIATWIVCSIVCMHVFMSISAHVSICVCMHARMYMWLHLCVCAYAIYISDIYM